MLVRKRRLALLFGVESGLLLLAVVGSSYFLLGQEAFSALSARDGVLKLVLVVSVCQVCLSYVDLYELRLLTGPSEVLLRLLQALGATSFILAFWYLIAPGWIIARGVFFGVVLLVFLLVASWRAVFSWWSRRASPNERLLLVGTSAGAVSLAGELLARREELGVEIVGFVDPDPAQVGTCLLTRSIVGTVDDIPSLITSLKVDRVVVSLADSRGKLPMDRLLDFRLDGAVTFDHLASIYEEYTGKIAVENLRPSWLIFAPGFRKTWLLLALKRTVDLIAAVVGLVLAAPLFALIACLVKTSRGPVFYHQSRVGLKGKVFTVHKFRTMRQDAEAGTGAVWSVANDSRVTGVGRFLRRVRFDELPQLWNVMAGEMSLVGPRPERPEFVSTLSEGIPFYRQRHVIKPGLTGWAQVRYTYGASVEDAIEKLQYDLYYIKHLSIWLDLAIIVDTVKTVLLGRGAR